MRTPKLLLYPTDVPEIPDLQSQLRTTLAGLGLLGDAFELDGRRHFEAGDRFLELVSLVGCSPSLELTPPEDPRARETAARHGRFCHLHIGPLFPMPVWRTGSRARPRCPACGTSAPAAQVLNAGGRCGSCAGEAPPESWRWRQQGARARLFLEVWGIHESEALPTPGLTQALESITDSAWSHCFVDEPADPPENAADETGRASWHNNRPI